MRKITLFVLTNGDSYIGVLCDKQITLFYEILHVEY
jgi:hypothetical protein